MAATQCLRAFMSKKKIMKTINPLPVLFCLAIFFTACKKDKSANRTTYLTVHRHGSGQIAYTYDNNGRLIGETTKNARGETDVHLTYKEFNTAGMPGRIDYSFPANPLHKPYLLIEYDSDQRPAKVTNYATDGTPGPYDTYTYRTGSIEYRTFNASGAQQHYTIYTIDNTGNLITSDVFNADNVSTWKINYTGYDNKKAPTHPYKYLAAAVNETPNFFSANNYTGYEAYNYSLLDARYACTYTYNQRSQATSRVTTDRISNVSSEESYEYVER